MDHDRLLDVLHHQILEVQGQLQRQRCRGENSEGTAALLRSLRLSLRLLAAGADPDSAAATGFVLSVSSEGRLLLRRDARLVRLSDGYLQLLLGNAGIELVPGETIFIERDFARRAVQESLGEAAAEEHRLDRRRAELLTALRQASGSRKEHLRGEIGRLDDQAAELRLRRIELSELNAVGGEAA
jgi:hypothetical protein